MWLSLSSHTWGLLRSTPSRWGVTGAFVGLRALGIFGVPGLCLSLLAAQDSGLRWFRSPITQN